MEVTPVILSRIQFAFTISFHVIFRAFTVGLAAWLTCLQACSLILRRLILLASLCLALGLQNGAVGKVRGVAFHTTFITGLSTTLVTSLIAGRLDPVRLVLPPVIGCFVAGALCGAVTASRAGVPGDGLVLPPLAAAWLLAATELSA